MEKQLKPGSLVVVRDGGLLSDSESDTEDEDEEEVEVSDYS